MKAAVWSIALAIIAIAMSTPSDAEAPGAWNGDSTTAVSINVVSAGDGQEQDCNRCWENFCQPGPVNECPAGWESNWYHAAGGSTCPDDLSEDDPDGPQWHPNACYGEDPERREFSHTWPAVGYCAVSGHEECPAEHVPTPETVAATVQREDSLKLNEWIAQEGISFNVRRSAIQIADCNGALIAHIPVNPDLAASLLHNDSPR